MYYKPTRTFEDTELPFWRKCRGSLCREESRDHSSFVMKVNVVGFCPKFLCSSGGNPCGKCRTFTIIWCSNLRMGFYYMCCCCRIILSTALVYGSLIYMFFTRFFRYCCICVAFYYKWRGCRIECEKVNLGLDSSNPLISKLHQSISSHLKEQFRSKAQLHNATPIPIEFHGKFKD